MFTKCSKVSFHEQVYQKEKIFFAKLQVPRMQHLHIQRMPVLMDIGTPEILGHTVQVLGIHHRILLGEMIIENLVNLYPKQRTIIIFIINSNQCSNKLKVTVNTTIIIIIIIISFLHVILTLVNSINLPVNLFLLHLHELILMK